MSALAGTPTAALVATYNRAIEACELAPDEARFNSTLATLDAIGVELDERGARVTFNPHGYLSIHNPHEWQA